MPIPEPVIVTREWGILIGQAWVMCPPREKGGISPTHSMFPEPGEEGNFVL